MHTSSPSALPTNETALPHTAQPLSRGLPTGTRKRALLVGIDRYRHAGDFQALEGCKADVENMGAVLHAVYAFRDAEIRSLQDEEATLEGVSRAFREHLIDGAGATTVALLYFCGHGSQIYDENGDEPDHWDETLVMHDSGRVDHENRDLTDDALGVLLAELGRRTPHSTVILDSCHSGTASREGGTARLATRDPRRAPKTAIAAEDGSGMADGPGRYALIAAARSDQRAYERRFGDTTQGVFTHFLTESMRAAKPGASYRDLIEQVQVAVTTLFPQQSPQLEGAARDDVVFGLERTEPARYVEATREGEGFKLSAGSVHGVTVGSEFEVFPVDVPGGATGGKVHATVTRVDVVSSILSMSETPTRRSRAEATHAAMFARGRAVEVRHVYRGQRVRLACPAAEPGAVVTQICARLGAEGAVEVVNDRAPYDLALVKDADGSMSVETATPGTRAVKFAPGPRIVEDIVTHVLSWTRWFAVRALHGPVATTGALSLEITPTNGATSHVLQAGDEVVLTVRNQLSRTRYFSVLVLSADGAITTLYPPNGPSEAIAPGQPWSYHFRACTRSASSSSLDVVKVIATDAPTDFHALTQRALVRSGADVQPPTLDGSWDVAERALEVRTKPGAALCP